MRNRPAPVYYAIMTYIAQGQHVYKALIEEICRQNASQRSLEDLVSKANMHHARWQQVEAQIAGRKRLTKRQAQIVLRYEVEAAALAMAVDTLTDMLEGCV